MYHFIGIKGSGMSSLAIIMKQLGFNVNGSDYDKHYFTEDGLIKNNISITSFSKDNIKDDMIIVKGNMFNDDNIEVITAKEKNLKIYTYQEMVGYITKNYNLIAVSGCHGKTTTSSILAHILNSNYLIGDGSGGVADNNYFVLEACEYKRHFLNYYPNYTIITNIDLDHVDYYKDINDLINAYQDFTNQSNIVIACGDDDNVLKINNISYLYGTRDNNYFQAKNIEYYSNGVSFDLYVDKHYIYHFDLPFYGKHMVLNTLGVIGVCYLEGVGLDFIYDRLKKFNGAKRRFNEYSIIDNIVIDDYAHHPNEIKSVINAARQKYPNRELITIFEPHTYSRTAMFYKEIALELNKSDYSYVMDIYPSRESQTDYPNITSKLILDYLSHGESLNYNDIDKLLNYHNSVLLFMSPNDIRAFENNYVNKYKEKYSLEKLDK